MNVMNVIHPYLDDGTWAFDDPDVGLSREPFICGIPEIIRMVVGGATRFKLTFSGAWFPGHTTRLYLVGAEGGGNWYRFEHTDSTGWLCPALFKYFEVAPEIIYLKAEVEPEIVCHAS